MISNEQLIKDFSFLGKDFYEASVISPEGISEADSGASILADAAEQSFRHNAWFIPEFVKFCFSAWTKALEEKKIAKWLAAYPEENRESRVPKTVGLIMAGNIPMVGLHDLLCVLASGNKALIKLSSQDEILIPAALKVLNYANPRYENLITYIEGPLKKFDAIIATGNNNSSRYFDYYFGRYPHIIRKNRNGVAVISGEETVEELEKLADDIFIYFGLGCRNVSKIYLPEGYPLERLLQSFSNYAYFSDLHKYRNNYDYQKSLLLINRVPHLDNGFLLVREDPSLMSPISVIHTETYHSADLLNKQLFRIRDQVQCIVSCNKEVNGAILPGCSQFPELWDYADGTDTMEFLMKV